MNQFEEQVIDALLAIHKELEAINGNTTRKKSTGTKSKAKGRKKYGKYKHVLLNDEEYKAVEELYGLNTGFAIQYLDDAIEAKGYKYNNFKLVLTKSDSWVRENVMNLLGQNALKNELF